MSYCNLCNQESNESTHNIKHFVMEFIAKSYPSWIENDGSCPKCENLYNNDLSSLVSVSSSFREY